MKILVIGKNGQLGKSIHKIVTSHEQNSEFVFVGREALDLSSQDSIISYFNNNSFDIIINCAAYTAVDNTLFGTYSFKETDPQSYLQSIRNTLSGAGFHQIYSNSLQNKEIANLYKNNSSQWTKWHFVIHSHCYAS